MGVVMARRPTYARNDAMTEAELEEYRRSLQLLSPHIVKGMYTRLVDKCRFLELPTPRMMQELVTLWKVLWQWRK
jgi:hypothetical protein